MSRSRAVLDKLAARAAPQVSQPAAGIRNRPAMPITSSSSLSSSTGRSQPTLSIRSQKAALQRQVVPTSRPTDELISNARHVRDRLQARLGSRAPAAASISVKKAKVVETCGAVRRPHVSRQDSASLQKQGKPPCLPPRCLCTSLTPPPAVRPAPLSKGRQRMTDAAIEELLIDSLFPSSQSSPSESSMTTGRSFSFVAPSREMQGKLLVTALAASEPR